MNQLDIHMEIFHIDIPGHHFFDVNEIIECITVLNPNVNNKFNSVSHVANGSH